MPLAAVLVVGGLFCFPGGAAAADVDYDKLFAPFAGSASGKNGLVVNWAVKNDVAGKTKEESEENAWLVVTPSRGGKTLPALYQEGDYLALGAPAELPLVTLEDYNFDGHDDLQLVEGMSARGAYGPVYLFNPADGNFVKSEPLSELQMLGVDKKNKLLTAHYHENACVSASRKYLVKGFDTLELVFEAGTECPDELLEKNQYRSFERSYKDGKLVLEKTDLHALNGGGEAESPAPAGADAGEKGSARLATDSFSAELPKGWNVSEEGAATIFQSDGEKPQSIVCAAFPLAKVDMDLLLQRYAPEGKKRKVSDASYLYVNNEGERCWMGVAESGDIFDICVSEPVEAMPAFLKSLETSSPDSSAAAFFKEAGTQTVVDWLAFATPDIPAGKAATAKGGAGEKQGQKMITFTGNKITAQIPAGWKAESSGQFVSFTAPEGAAGGFAAGAAIPLKSAEWEAFEKTSMTLIDKLGGKNVLDSEGSYEFQLPDNVMAITSHYNGVALLVMFRWDDDVSHELALSIELID